MSMEQLVTVENTTYLFLSKVDTVLRKFLAFKVRDGAEAIHGLIDTILDSRKAAMTSWPNS